MILIYYTKILGDLPTFKINELLKCLPPELIEKNLSYRKWEDRYLNLFGISLLLKALKRFGIEKDSLISIKYGPYGKPYLDQKINFNIAHSGKYSLCAVSDKVNFGVDLEQIKTIDFNDFDHTMTDNQWEIIKGSVKPVDLFFRFWAIKESVIKADARGMSIPLKEIEIHGDNATCLGQKWYLQELNIDDCYCAFLAMDSSNNDILVEYVNYY